MLLILQTYLCCQSLLTELFSLMNKNEHKPVMQNIQTHISKTLRSSQRGQYLYGFNFIFLTKYEITVSDISS